MSETSPSPTDQPKPKCCQNPWLISLIVSIFGMIVPLLIGVSGTVFGMIGAFKSLNENNEADPSELADNISQSMTTTAIGIVVSLIFLILFVISLVMVLSNRKRKQP